MAGAEEPGIPAELKAGLYGALGGCCEAVAEEEGIPAEPICNSELQPSVHMNLSGWLSTALKVH